MIQFPMRKQYRIVEVATKDADQKTRIHYQIQYLKTFFGMFGHWVYITEYTYPDGLKTIKEFYFKDRAIEYVKNLRAPLPKDKYTYM